MRKISLIVLVSSVVLTVVFTFLWALGFGFAGAAVGNLIHILLILALISGFGVFVGLILLAVSFYQKIGKSLQQVS